jgi:hypothetical protein
MNNKAARRSETSPLLAQKARAKWAIRVVVIALIMLFASAFAFASTPQGTFEKTLPISGPVDLEVLTHSGDVTVHAGSSGSVVIRGKIFVSDRWLRGDRQSDVREIAQHPPIRQEGNSIHVDYVNVHNISVDYEITVPADTAIRTRSGSGDQIIEGTHGNVDVQTGSGDLKLRNLTGEVRLQTGSGDVRAREIAGAVRGGAGSGDIEIGETGPGDVDLHTGVREYFGARRSGRVSCGSRQWRRHGRRGVERHLGNPYGIGQCERAPAGQCRVRRRYFQQFRHCGR